MVLAAKAEEDLKEDQDPKTHKMCLGGSSDVALNRTPEVDASDENTEDDNLDLVDSSDSEVEVGGYLDHLGGNIIVNHRCRRTHRLICSNGTVISNYE